MNIKEIKKRLQEGNDRFLLDKLEAKLQDNSSENYLN